MSFDITQYRLNPSLRFKNLPKKISDSSNKYYDKNNIIRFTKISQIGSLLSSVEFNEFAKDIKFNNNNIINIINNLDQSINNSSAKLFRAAENLSINLINYKLQTATLRERFEQSSKLLLMNFTSNINNFLYDSSANYDILARTHLDNNHCYHIKGLGLTSSVKEIIKIKPINLFYDLNESNIGQILYQSSYDDWKDESVFWMNFFSVYRNSTFNFTRDTVSLTICAELGGLQEINNIYFETTSQLEIESIYYLDQNENEVILDYNSYDYNYHYNIIFNNITTNNLKIKFKLISNNEQTLYNDIYGKINSFLIKNLYCNLYKLNDIGYATIKLDSNINGLKLVNNFISDDYQLDVYLKIKYQALGKWKEATIPLYERYDSEITIIPYFVNNLFELIYFPSQNFKLYKNNVELILDTDYTLIPGGDIADPVPTYTNRDSDVVLVKLINYDYNAKYKITYTPYPGARVGQHFTYNYDYLNLKSKLKNSIMSIQYIMRRKNSSGEDFPILNLSKVIVNEFKPN